MTKIFKKIIICIKSIFYPIQQPCRRHYFEIKSFKNCPDCGWSKEITYPK